MEDNKNIFPTDISKEMKDSYLQYAMSVIVGRALPDVRDGLKPVHRRVLYAMRDLSNTFDKPYKKSARVVGDVIGKYHPHGEAAVYDTIVRMAQDFSMNHTLIDGQGNFGSIDGDSAAASRYTEIRMTKLASELLVDIEKDTVQFEWNYDDSLLIPVVLPSQIPNLLINGSAGIAVGMASNVPSHNLGEVVEALIQLLNQDLSLDELISLIPGPDFPTAGSIIGRKGIIQAYKTGRGSIIIRAKTEIEEQGGKEQIIIQELPYQVNKAHLIESIASLVRDKKIDGISDIRDESSREGMRVVIVLKKRENAQVILNNLYKQTKLQSSFGIHLLALDKNGQPKTFNLKEVLLAFLAHRKDIVTRRLVFELNKAQERLHILEGLTKALDHLDQVISLIRESKEVSQAKQGLMSSFGLSPIQAQSILDLRLQKLTGLERKKIMDEYQSLQKLVQDITNTLGDSKKIDHIIQTELKTIKESFSKPRQTLIESAQDDLTDKDLITEEDVVVLITSQSGVKRIPLEEYRVQKRGGVGLKGVSLGLDGEWVWKALCVSTHTTLVVLTDKGKLYHLEAFKIPSGTRTSKSKSIRNLLSFDSDENVRSVVPVADFLTEDQSLCMVSALGVFKKTSLSFFARPRQAGVNALSVKNQDSLMKAIISSSENDILIVSKQGMGIRFKESSVRLIKSRTSSGVKGMNLKAKDQVINLHSLPRATSSFLFTVSEQGYGKLTLLEQFRATHRGGVGVKVHKLTQKTGNLAGSLIVEEHQQILMVTNKGQTIRFSCQDVSRQGRMAQGVRLIRLKTEERVTGISIIDETGKTVEQTMLNKVKNLEKNEETSEPSNTTSKGNGEVH